MTPLNMLETVITEIIEATSLLEIIYSHSEENPETDNAIACLIRSLNQTKNKASEYVLNSAGASNSTNKDAPSAMKLPENKVAVNKSELTSISDRASKIMVITRLLSNNCGIEKTEMEFALKGIAKLALNHNVSLLDLIEKECGDE